MTREVTIVDVNSLETIEAGVGRTGRIITKELPVPIGIPNLDMDFELATFTTGYFTPRHRHTFDQVRYILSGTFQSEVGDLKTDECGYYPEGVPYGPQKQDNDVTVLILQFPGPSNIPYIRHSELANARKRLIEQGGTFETGVYTIINSDGKKTNKDAHAACFEAVTGKKMEFPEGRFAQPIFMRPQAQNWVTDRHLQGVAHKCLGTFGEWRTGVSMTRLESGAHLPARVAEDAEIIFVLDGSINYNGKSWVGGRSRECGTHLYIPHGSAVNKVTTDAGATLFRINLPMMVEVERMNQLAPQNNAAVA